MIDVDTFLTILYVIVDAMARFTCRQKRYAPVPNSL